jgi:spermidine/putrescine transport system ATP-binding protein
VRRASVQVDSVAQRFGSFTALDGVSLSVAAGEFAVLLGPSGSGKTTLLSIIGGFLTPAAGRVLIDGRDMTTVPPAKRPTATVFQDYALFPHMNLGANVAFGLRMRGMPRKTRCARAEEMLALVGLGGTAAKKPHELSGGQRQRVALARSLAVEPAVLLLDEPLGALDLKLRRQMQEELKRIQREVGTTFIHVTHDQEEAMAIADRVVVMNAGRIEDEGEPQRVYLKPRTRFSAGFMGQSSLLDGSVADVGLDVVAVATKLGTVKVARANAENVAIGEPVLLSIRPEHFSIAKAEHGTQPLGEAVVQDISFQGTVHQARMRHLGDQDFRPTVLLPQTTTARPGDTLALFVRSDSPVLLKKT